MASLVCVCDMGMARFETADHWNSQSAEAAMYIVDAVILSMLAAAALVAFVARAAAEGTSEDRLNP
jgi:hypothetical protein